MIARWSNPGGGNVAMNRIKSCDYRVYFENSCEKAWSRRKDDY